jgi:hypothetical protein
MGGLSWTAGLLSWWQWALLAAVPPAIVALYFLKLRRTPIEVPSTYLWRKSIEDLHVNSLWQRLRQSLLLFLQVLLVLLAILALFGPGWRGTDLAGDRFIFLVDTSASMSAKDVPPTRLDSAKEQVRVMIDNMKPGDTAMIVSFSDRANIEQEFTRNKKELRRSLDQIKQTQRGTSLKEALRVASGLANPGRRAFETSDAAVAEALPATVYILSDGRFDPVKDFSLGNLTPQFVKIGTDLPANLAITAFGTRRNLEKPGQIQAFARLENWGPETVTAPVEMHLDGTFLDTKNVEVAAGEASGVAFDLKDVNSGVLELAITSADNLPLDSRAWSTINPPSRSRVLLVTPGNEPLMYALSTPRTALISEVIIQPPPFVNTKEFEEKAAAGDYDLVIFDRQAPPKIPNSHTLFIGCVPPGDRWKADEKRDLPQIIDVDKKHPIMQLLELGDVIILEGTPLTPPQGAAVLVDSHVGPMMAIAPREGFEDLVMGFELVGADHIGTNWPVRLSFPVFILNMLSYFSGNQDVVSTGNVRPGGSITLHSEQPGDTIAITTPTGQKVQVKRGGFNTYRFSQTDELGVYDVAEKDQVTQRFSVNLFDSSESNLNPVDTVEIGYEKTAAQQAVEVVPVKAWKILVLLGLLVLLFEWYIYNRRVYL